MKSIFIFVILILIALYILVTDRTVISPIHDQVSESFSLKEISDQYNPKIRTSGKIYKTNKRMIENKTDFTREAARDACHRIPSCKSIVCITKDKKDKCYLSENNMFATKKNMLEDKSNGDIESPAYFAGSDDAFTKKGQQYYGTVDRDHTHGLLCNNWTADSFGEKTIQPSAFSGNLDTNSIGNYLKIKNAHKKNYVCTSPMCPKNEIFNGNNASMDRMDYGDSWNYARTSNKLSQIMNKDVPVCQINVDNKEECKLVGGKYGTGSNGNCTVPGAKPSDIGKYPINNTDIKPVQLYKDCYVTNTGKQSLTSTRDNVVIKMKKGKEDKCLTIDEDENLKFVTCSSIDTKQKWKFNVDSKLELKPMVVQADKDMAEQPVYKSHPEHGMQFKQPNLCKLHRTNNFSDNEYEIVPCAGNIVNSFTNKCLQFDGQDAVSLGKCKYSHKTTDNKNKINNQLWYHDAIDGYIQGATGNRKCLEKKGDQLGMDICGKIGKCDTISKPKENQLFIVDKSKEIQCPPAPSIFNTIPIGRSDINITQNICKNGHGGCFDQNYDGNQYNCYYPSKFRPKKDCYEIESIAVHSNSFLIVRKIKNIYMAWYYDTNINISDLLNINPKISTPYFTDKINTLDKLKIGKLSYPSFKAANFGDIMYDSHGDIENNSYVMFQNNINKCPRTDMFMFSNTKTLSISQQLRVCTDSTKYSYGCSACASLSNTNLKQSNIYIFFNLDKFWIKYKSQDIKDMVKPQPINYLVKQFPEGLGIESNQILYFENLRTVFEYNNQYIGIVYDNWIRNYKYSGTGYKFHNKIDLFDLFPQLSRGVDCTSMINTVSVKNNQIQPTELCNDSLIGTSVTYLEDSKGLQYNNTYGHYFKDNINRTSNDTYICKSTGWHNKEDFSGADPGNEFRASNKMLMVFLTEKYCLKVDPSNLKAKPPVTICAPASSCTEGESQFTVKTSSFTLELQFTLNYIYTISGKWGHVMRINPTENSTFKDWPRYLSVWRWPIYKKTDPYRLHVRIGTIMNGNDGINIDLTELSIQPTLDKPTQEYTLCIKFSSKRKATVSIFNNLVNCINNTPSVSAAAKIVEYTPPADILITRPMDYKVEFTTLPGLTWETQDQIISYTGYLTHAPQSNIHNGVDTIGWKNGSGHGCDDYAKLWCKDGGARAGEEWALGKKYNYPEKNCTVCGKKGPTINPSSSVLYHDTSNNCLKLNVENNNKIVTADMNGGWIGFKPNKTAVNSISDPNLWIFYDIDKDYIKMVGITLDRNNKIINANNKARYAINKHYTIDTILTSTQISSVWEHYEKKRYKGKVMVPNQSAADYSTQVRNAWTVGYGIMPETFNVKLPTNAGILKTLVTYDLKRNLFKIGGGNDGGPGNCISSIPKKTDLKEFNIGYPTDYFLIQSNDSKLWACPYGKKTLYYKDLSIDSTDLIPRKISDGNWTTVQINHIINKDQCVVISGKIIYFINKQVHIYNISDPTKQIKVITLIAQPSKLTLDDSNIYIHYNKKTVTADMNGGWIGHKPNKVASNIESNLWVFYNIDSKYIKMVGIILDSNDKMVVSPKPKPRWISSFFKKNTTTSAGILDLWKMQWPTPPYHYTTVLYSTKTGTCDGAGTWTCGYGIMPETLRVYNIQKISQSKLLEPDIQYLSIPTEFTPMGTSNDYFGLDNNELVRITNITKNSKGTITKINATYNGGVIHLVKIVGLKKCLIGLDEPGNVYICTLLPNQIIPDGKVWNLLLKSTDKGSTKKWIGATTKEGGDAKLCNLIPGGVWIGNSTSKGKDNYPGCASGAWCCKPSTVRDIKIYYNSNKYYICYIVNKNISYMILPDNIVPCDLSIGLYPCPSDSDSKSNFTTDEEGRISYTRTITQLCKADSPSSDAVCITESFVGNRTWELQEPFISKITENFAVSSNQSSLALHPSYGSNSKFILETADKFTIKITGSTPSHYYSSIGYPLSRDKVLGITDKKHSFMFSLSKDSPTRTERCINPIQLRYSSSLRTVVECVSGYPKLASTNLFNNQPTWISKFMVSNYRYGNDINLVLDQCSGNKNECTITPIPPTPSDNSNLIKLSDENIKPTGENIKMTGVVYLNEHYGIDKYLNLIAKKEPLPRKHYFLSGPTDNIQLKGVEDNSNNTDSPHGSDAIYKSTLLVDNPASKTIINREINDKASILTYTLRPKYKYRIHVKLEQIDTINVCNKSKYLEFNPKYCKELKNSFQLDVTHSDTNNKYPINQYKNNECIVLQDNYKENDNKCISNIQKQNIPNQNIPNQDIVKSDILDQFYNKSNQTILPRFKKIIFNALLMHHLLPPSGYYLGLVTKFYTSFHNLLTNSILFIATIEQTTAIDTSGNIVVNKPSHLTNFPGLRIIQKYISNMPFPPETSTEKADIYIEKGYPIIFNIITKNEQLIIDDKNKVKFIKEMGDMFHLIKYMLDKNYTNTIQTNLRNLIYTTNMIYNYTQEIPSVQNSACHSKYSQGLNLINKQSKQNVLKL